MGYVPLVYSPYEENDAKIQDQKRQWGMSPTSVTICLQTREVT